MRARGFTLIELLVAVFLLAVLSALAYETLAYVHRAREGSTASFARLREVERGMHTLVTDFEQMTPRPIRQPVGSGWLPAMVGDTRTQDIAVFTRTGWGNSAGLQRSTLQRVTYTFDSTKGVLTRSYTTVLDATLTSAPVKTDLLTNVSTVTLRYMDGSHQWQTQWPALAGGSVAPPPTAGPQSPLAALRSRPIAVEITVELKDFGKIVRLVEISG
jgi:general secretion pathway protein J